MCSTLPSLASWRVRGISVSYRLQCSTSGTGVGGGPHGESLCFGFGFVFVLWSDFLLGDRKKPSSTGKNSKVVRDDSAKDLFEMGEWARDEVNMGRVGKSVLMYAFAKDGNASRGERADEKVSCVSAGQTYKIAINEFMFEDKKGESGKNVLPSDLDVIPAYSVVEIAITPGHVGSYDQGWGLKVTRVRLCPFSLYSMLSPLGLELLPKRHDESVRLGEASVEVSPGLNRVLEVKNTGFFGKVTDGSYLVKYNDDIYRLVGPKVVPADPLSKHADVMDGGVFAVDIRKQDLMRFTNAVESKEEDSLFYARCMVDLASSAGALSCYVAHNEYLLRKDANRSPFQGVPLIDSGKLLECVPTLSLGVDGCTKFPCNFPAMNLEAPFLNVKLECVDNNSLGCDVLDRPCGDLVLASENARVNYAYPVTLGDEEDPAILQFLFVPKGGVGAADGSLASGGGSGVGIERVDYRLEKRRRVNAAG